MARVGEIAITNAFAQIRGAFTPMYKIVHGTTYKIDGSFIPKVLVLNFS